jgi:hypothetical protein
MSWIKRNLYFLVGSLVALGLMVVAGFYIFSRWNLNTAVQEKLYTAYDTLKTLNDQTPNPGSPGKVDNVKAALDQRQEILAFTTNATAHFARIPSIPDAGKVTSESFASSLRQIIDQLQRDAASASVSLPPKCGFTFEAQQPLVKFAPGSLEPLSVRLGEIKALCDILIRAKINSLDSLRRERVSADDATGPETVYTDRRSQTNNLAVLIPYDISFRCFGPELAAVLAGFANSPHCFIVNSLSVEPASATAAGEPTPATPAASSVTAYTPPPPPAPVSRPTARRGLPEEEAMMQMDESQQSTKGAPPPRVVTPRSATASAASTARGGLQTVLNEKQLKVTMSVMIVKLLPKK